jgi:Bacterial Ig domain
MTNSANHSAGRVHRLMAMRPIASFLALTMLGVASVHAATHPRLVITPAAGFTIAWDGNNGGFNSPDVGAGPSNNIALASNGTLPFTSSDLGPELGIPFHVAANLNDGLYGNINSWISGSAPDPYAALRFAAPVNITSIAWSRDNGLAAGDSCGGTCVDRAVGTYTLQITQVASPDGTTADTGDAATGWVSIGTVQYLPGAEDASFTSYLRHRYDVTEGGSPIAATGLRIKVSIGGIGGGLDIDEIEVNPIPDLVPPLSNFIEITPAPGFAIGWDKNEGNFGTPNNPAPVPANDASTSRGATPFTSTDLGPAIGVPFHVAGNLNDGFYGNANSWIPNFIGGDPAPFAGINFGRRITLSSVAWGRDNGNVAGDCCGGTLTDRALGVYILQITTAPNPSGATPEACSPSPDSGWITVGTINYKANSPAQFNSYLRHRFDVSQGGAPIAATGIRIKAPNAQSAIDEIEVNSNLALEQNSVRITNAPDATIVWDGNNGDFNNPATDAAPPPNRALASAGTTAFSSSDLGPLLGIPFHRAVNLNDGLYGNANSWISANGVGGNSDPDPFVGLSFGASVSITNIAWSRDNGNTTEGGCAGGTCTDRALDTYRIQFTTVGAPDATTPDTGDSATGWQDVGTVLYASATPPFFTPHLRHRFDLSASGLPLDATGIRIKIANGNTAIDEIEINTAGTPPPPPPPPSPVAIAAAAGYAIAWDGNDGHYNNPAEVAIPPYNRALASAGTTPFTSSDLGPVIGVPFHVAGNLNDGRYGNANSWIPNFIGGDATPFAGLRFNGPVAITNIAWSRDNGNVPADCCGGTATDRVLGLYTLQITTVASPDGSTPETGDASTGWKDVGSINYLRAEPPNFNPHLRHRFDVSSAGGPILATGLRIKVPDANSDIDEIEVNTATTPPPCCNVEPSFSLAGSSTASDEDAGPVTVAAWLLNVSAGAGESGQVATVHVSNDNPALFSAQPSFDASGALTYTSVPNAIGSANVSVFVTDNGGTGVCGDDTSATSVFVITIRPVNDCPVAGNMAVDTGEDTAVSFALPSYEPDLDPVTYAISVQPLHGTVSGTAPFVTYTPAANYSGPDSFSYTANDGQCTSTGMVSITVLPLNDCPIAGNQSVNTDENAAVTIVLTGLDADGDQLTFTATSPTHGTLSGTGANRTYTPAPNYCGPDSFTYTVSDGAAGCPVASGTVSITVRCVNSCPIAEATVDPSCVKTGATSILIVANEHDHGCVILDGRLSSDADGDALTYSWLADGGLAPISLQALTTNCFDIGEHEVTLVVDDGRCLGMKTVRFEVVTACDLIENLVQDINNSTLPRNKKRPLIDSLKKICKHFEKDKKNKFKYATKKLEDFQKKVKKELKNYPALSAQFCTEAQIIIDSINCAVDLHAKHHKNRH